jgi:hypothetical protein
MLLDGRVIGGCIGCGRALDLATARSSPRKRFGVQLDWLYEAECVDDECSAVTEIMASLDALRFPHRAYRKCAIPGCIYSGVHAVCIDCTSVLPGNVRGDIVMGRSGGVEQAIDFIGSRSFIPFEGGRDDEDQGAKRRSSK